jgi:antitoxin component of MazEF toxin-antitoxin module
MVQTVVKRWGNSYGVILPVRIVREHELSENDIIDVRIEKKVRKIMQLYGTLKTEVSTQKIKDGMRAGWNG